MALAKWRAMAGVMANIERKYESVKYGGRDGESMAISASGGVKIYMLMAAWRRKLKTSEAIWRNGNENMAAKERQWRM
jgi:hypothetical protein